MASCEIFIAHVSGKPLAILNVRNYALRTTQLCIRVKVSASRDLALVEQFFLRNMLFVRSNEL